MSSHISLDADRQIATHQKHISALLRNSSLLIPCLPTHEETLSYQSTVPQSTNKRAAASRANNSPFYQPGETPTKKKRAKPTALSALATGASINDDDDDGMSSKAKKAAKEKEREKKKKRSYVLDSQSELTQQCSWTCTFTF